MIVIGDFYRDQFLLVILLLLFLIMLFLKLILSYTGLKFIFISYKFYNILIF